MPRSICSLIRSSTFSLFSPFWSRTGSCRGEAGGRDHSQAPARAHPDHGVAARRIRRAAVLHHDRQDGNELVNAIAQKNRRTALWMALLVAAMIGLAFASPPIYRTFCSLTG